MELILPSLHDSLSPLLERVVLFYDPDSKAYSLLYEPVDKFSKLCYNEENAARVFVNKKEDTTMGLFDQFTASVSKTAKQVSGSAKVLADKNRIRRDLAAMENELRNRFRDIGEKFYQETRENPDPAYQELFDAISELQNNLVMKQHELESLDGMVTCTECGRAMAKDAKFCPNCGATAPVYEPPVMHPENAASVCPVCGASLAPDAMFCASCGNKIEHTPVVPAVPVPPRCPNCNTELASDALFCPNCGTAIPGLK